MKNSVESALFENIQKRIKNESFEFTGIINKSLEEVFEDDITYLSQQKKILDKIC
jgi:F0F1-type ATP synthase delta subunit